MKRIIPILLLIVTTTIFCENVQAQNQRQAQSDKRRLNREELANKQAEQLHLRWHLTKTPANSLSTHTVVI